MTGNTFCVDYWLDFRIEIHPTLRREDPPANQPCTQHRKGRNQQSFPSKEDHPAIYSNPRNRTSYRLSRVPRTRAPRTLFAGFEMYLIFNKRMTVRRPEVAPGQNELVFRIRFERQLQQDRVVVIRIAQEFGDRIMLPP